MEEFSILAEEAKGYSPELLCENKRSILVEAGPGTGKTELLADRAINLLNKGGCRPPQRILAISFKRDSAKSLKDRVEKLADRDKTSRFQSMTFDSFTKQIIDMYGSTIEPKWRPTQDYEIKMENDPQMSKLIAGCAEKFGNGRSFLNALSITDIDHLKIGNSMSSTILEFWRECYKNNARTTLTFEMINRLAKHVLLQNSIIVRALRKTYPIVFIDEFQDTTNAQYDFLNTAFSNKDTSITAVGDEKQSIMGWVGAKEDIFDAFRTDHKPVLRTLNINWRTHKRMIELQYNIAKLIDKRTIRPGAGRKVEVNGVFSAILEFKNEEIEAKTIAKWIGDGVEINGWNTKDIALLRRYNKSVPEGVLHRQLMKYNLHLRDVGRYVGEIEVKELLSQQIIIMLFSILKLSVERVNPEAWETALRYQFQINETGVRGENEQYVLQKQAHNFIFELREAMKGEPNKESVEEIMKKVMLFWGKEKVMRAFPAYRREQDLDRVLNGAKILLQEGVAYAKNWRELIEWFEGRGHVPIMTVHKCKGQEFERVVLMGVNKRDWLYMSKRNIKELKVLFVALTRARRRVFISYCKSRGAEHCWLRKHLSAHGVKVIDGTKLVNIPW